MPKYELRDIDPNLWARFIERANTRLTTTNAIVDATGRILSLHTAPVPAGEGWGHDRELVELVRPHHVGDVIDYDARGIEVR